MPYARSADPHLRLLASPDSRELLAAALAPTGGTLRTWAIRDIDHRPGARTTVSYTVKVAWPDGVREETLGASVTATGFGADVDRGRRFIVTDGEHDVEVWRYPFDPELPALAAASYPRAAAEMLRRTGMAAETVSARVLSYRPRKRAVLELNADGHRWFVKVMRPWAAEDVRRRLTLLSESGLPVPECLGWSDDGLLVLRPLPGMPMRQAIANDGARAGRPEDLVSLLDRLPDAARELPRRRPWADHVTHYAGIVASALPEEADRSQSIAAEVEAALTAHEPGDEPTHGDFYEAQLMVDRGRVTGLLDVDTVGPGRRADDLAAMLAHLSVLTIVAPHDAGPGHALRAWTPVFDERVDPHELRARAAAVVMSLATGPFRTQEPDWPERTADLLTLARRWLDAAPVRETPF